MKPVLTVLTLAFVLALASDAQADTVLNSGQTLHDLPGHGGTIGSHDGHTSGLDCEAFSPDAAEEFAGKILPVQQQMWARSVAMGLIVVTNEKVPKASIYLVSPNDCSRAAD